MVIDVWGREPKAFYLCPQSGYWRRLIPDKDVFGLYDISDLKVGGDCGCCGHWVPLAIVAKGCGWTLCDKCLNGK